MGRPGTISLDVQNLIVQEVKRGGSYRDVAARFGVTKSGVWGAMKRSNERLGVVIKKVSGRPREASIREEKLIKRRSTKSNHCFAC